jgi:hypothetical protein
MPEVMDYSEFCTAPARILLHHPQHGNSLQSLAHDRLQDLNFLDFPDSETLHREYDRFASDIGSHVDTVFLGDILRDDADYQNEAATNPNLMFMRDSSITLPWRPDVFISARLALRSRSREPASCQRRCAGSACNLHSASLMTSSWRAGTCFRR